MTSKTPSIIPVILCGGSGTRLWPLSRKNYPKQFLKFGSDLSLFQQSVERARLFSNTPVIVTTQAHLSLIQLQLGEMKQETYQIILEPEGRDTAPAITAAALSYPKDILLVMPSDHLIENLKEFKICVDQAAKSAHEGFFVTFGITPTRPEVGFGYIQKGEAITQTHPATFQVARFKEKPDASTAADYVQDGCHFWNAGIFVFQAQKFLDQMKTLQGDLVTAVSKALDLSETKNQQVLLNQGAYQSAPKISIDYAFVEKCPKTAVVQASFDWCDLGSYEAIHQNFVASEEMNHCHGNVVNLNNSGCFLDSEGITLGVMGLKDVVVVARQDAVLVTSKSESVNLKLLTNALEKKDVHCLAGQTDYRPWGYYEILSEGPGYKVKRIHVYPGCKISLQFHLHRTEHWTLVQGQGTVTKGENHIPLKANETIRIDEGETHRIENTGQDILVFIEVQYGSYLGEDDIVRLEDAYGRETPKEKQ